jgi:hypothetical protein
MDSNLLPHFAKGRNLDTALAAWVNGQLPLEKFSFNQPLKVEGFNSLVRFADYSYVEPNQALVTELTANSVMMEKMLAALQIDREYPSVLRLIQDLSADLTFLQEIITKELNGETLDEEDNARLIDFAKKLSIEGSKIANRQLIVKFSNLKNGLKEDISRLKLLVVVRKENDEKVISVGPVWDYQESRQ